MAKFFNPFSRVLSAAEVMTDGVALVPGVWNEVAVITVQPGQGLQLGWGDYRGQHDAQGRFFYDPQDENGPIEGDVRIYLRDANDNSVKKLFQDTLSNTRQGAANRSLRVPFWAQPDRIGPNMQIVFEIRIPAGATATAIDLAKSAADINCTQWSFQY